MLPPIGQSLDYLGNENDEGNLRDKGERAPSSKLKKLPFAPLTPPSLVTRKYVNKYELR